MRGLNSTSLNGTVDPTQGLHNRQVHQTCRANACDRCSLWLRYERRMHARTDPIDLPGSSSKP